MKLESFRIKNCFGFVDSGEIDFAAPSNLIYFLGRNSSGKTSVLRALSHFEHGATPKEHSNFENYERPEGEPLLRARFSLGKETDESLSSQPLVDFVIEHFGSMPIEIRKEEDGYVSEPNSQPASQVARLLNAVERVYTELVEEILAEGRVWIDKLDDGSYRFLGSQDNTVQFEARREAVEEGLGSLKGGAKFQVSGGSARNSTPLAFHQIEGHLFKQFPEIFLFTNRFSLDDDLPRSIREEHLSERQNDLTEAFMDLLGQQTLKSFLQASGRQRLDVLRNELQSKLDQLCARINEDTSNGDTDELVRIFVDRQDDVRVILDVGDGETYYEHLSDNTKFLVAYHVFQADRENKNSLSAVLLFDEPNMGFHPSAEGKMLRFLETLAERGNQVVVTTHSQYMIDLERLSAIRLMGRDEDRTLRVSNGIYKPASPGGDILALQPITEAIGLHYAEQLIVKDRVIVTEGYTDMLYLRAFKRIIGHEADLNIAPLRGDSQIGQFIPFLVSQGMAFKIILDSKEVKQSIQRDYPIPDEHFFTVPLPDGSDTRSGPGIEDLLTKEDFTHLITRYGLEVNDKKLRNISNSSYAKQEKIKPAIATKLYSDVEISLSEFEQHSLEAFSSVLDFCASEAWFRA